MDIEERGLTFSGLSTQTKEGRIADPARTGVVNMESKQLMELDILDLDAEESRLRKQQELNQKIMHQGNVITGQTEEFDPAKRDELKKTLIKDGAKISHGDRQHSTYIDEGKARRKEIKSYDTSAERGGTRRDSADLEGQERAWVRVKDKKGQESWKYQKITEKHFQKGDGKIDYERHQSFKKVASAIKKKNVEIELANVKEGKPADQGKKTFYQSEEGKFHVMDVKEAFERRKGTFKRPTPQITGYNRQGTLVTSTAPRVEGNVATTGKIKETQAKAQQKWGVKSLREALSKANQTLDKPKKGAFKPNVMGALLATGFGATFDPLHLKGEIPLANYSLAETAIARKRMDSPLARNPKLKRRQRVAL